jgi:hypothetical protein
VVSVDWLHMAQDEDERRVPLNTVMILRISEMAGNFLSI